MNRITPRQGARVRRNNNVAVSFDSAKSIAFAQPLLDIDVEALRLCDRVIALASKQTGRSRATRHRLFYLLQGRYRFTIEGEEHGLGRGSVISLPEGTHWQREHLSKTARWISVEIRPSPRWQHLAEAGHWVRKFSPTNPFCSTIFDFFRVTETQSRERRGEALQLADTLAQMLQSDMVLFTGSVAPPDPFTLLTDQIRRNPERPWRLDDMADQLGVSRRSVTTLFRHHYNMSANQLVIHYRIRKAVHLLCYETYTIKAIAEMVGYSHIKTFRQLFKRVTHLRPVDFRSGKKYLEDPTTGKWILV